MALPATHSPTTTMFSTTIIESKTSRARSGSLAMILASASTWMVIKPTFVSLPTEILLKIMLHVSLIPIDANRVHGRGPVERNASDSDMEEAVKDALAGKQLDTAPLCALALTSHALSELAHSVLYQTVSLNGLRAMELYSRTALSCAHRSGFTLSTESSHSPFTHGHALSFLGKTTLRLIIDVPERDLPDARRGPHLRVAQNQQERLYTAASSILGLGDSAPSFPSPILSSLRTLIVRSDVLVQNMKVSPWTIKNRVSPTPSELIIDTYLPSLHYHVSGISRPPTIPVSPLATLGSRLTHITIASPPASWRLPSQTLSALGGAPSLTHFSLVRKANANEDNDIEFVEDLQSILAQRSAELSCVVVAILPDASFSLWKSEYDRNEAEKTDNVEAGDDGDDDSWTMLDHKTRVLETYLSQSHIWIRLSELTAACQPAMTCRKKKPVVCIMPGSGDAWRRALDSRHGTGTSSCNNIYLGAPKQKQRETTPFRSGHLDLWTWAQMYESGRRAREAKMKAVAI